jgi:hypothetical protein
MRGQKHAPLISRSLYRFEVKGNLSARPAPAFKLVNRHANTGSSALAARDPRNHDWLRKILILHCEL